MLEGRWTIFVCTGCGEATGRHKACDAKREATPVVPVDDAAVERAMNALAGDEDPEHFRLIVEQVFEAAGEQS